MIAPILLSLCALADVGANGGVLVVSRASSPDLRTSWAEAVADLQAEAVARGFGLAPPPRLQPILEGRVAPLPAFRLNLDPIRTAYRNFEYAVAQTQARSLTPQILAEARAANIAPLLAELLRWRGAVAVAAGHVDLAQTIFTLLSRLAPGEALDRAVFPPPMIQQYERALAVAHGTGRLVVKTEPAGAVALLDGRPIALPADLSVQSGPHLLVVTCAGFARHAKIVDVRPGATAGVDLVLKQLAPEQLVRSLVARLMAPDGTREAIAPLGRALGARRVLVVEPQGPDSAQASLHDLETGAVARAGPVSRTEITGLLDQLALGGALVVGAADGDDGSGVLEAGWFWGVVVGGSAAAIAAVLVAVLLPRDLEVCVARDPAACE